MRALVMALVACSSPSAPPATNRAPVASGISIDSELGWLGVAPVESREPGDWRPEGPAAAYLPSRPDKAQQGVTFTIVDMQGTTGTVIGGSLQTLPYGCDDGQLEAIALDPTAGLALAPGAVWVLPTSAPASWAPRPIAIKPLAASETQRRYVAGPLALELVRVGDRKGTLAIAWNGRPVHRREFERDRRAGGETAPLDLTGHGVGVLEPLAAWSFADGQAILVAFVQPTYEGLHVRASIVTPSAGAQRDDLGFYLYQCAF